MRKCANTGSIGDGTIWVSPVESVLRVRTGERDCAAARSGPAEPGRLTGGRGSRTVDAAAGDAVRDDTDEQLFLATRPGLDA